jgi:hypothetical protein
MYPPRCGDCTHRGICTALAVGVRPLLTEGWGLYRPLGWRLYPTGVGHLHSGRWGLYPRGLNVTNKGCGMNTPWVGECTNRGWGRYPQRCGDCTPWDGLESTLRFLRTAPTGGLGIVHTDRWRLYTREIGLPDSVPKGGVLHQKRVATASNRRAGTLPKVGLGLYTTVGRRLNPMG